LRPGGKLLLDVRGKENFARNFDDRAWLRTGSSVVLSQRTANADFSRIHNKWTVISDGHSQQVRFSHWIYSAHELKSMCESAGFEQVDVFGGFDGRPYTPDASRLVVVARLT
jgi:hypothetical protein